MVHWPHGRCQGWSWEGRVSFGRLTKHNHNRDKWANSSTYFKSNLFFFFFFLAKQIIDSVKWEPFVVIFRGEKRENAADALQFAAICSCWIIMRSSATIKASWRQQFVLETLLRQWNNKPRCVGGAISWVLPPPSYCHFLNMFCISSANLANE